MKVSDLIFIADKAGVRIARGGSTLSAPQADVIRRFAANVEVRHNGGLRVLRREDGQFKPVDDESLSRTIEGIRQDGLCLGDED